MSPQDVRAAYEAVAGGSKGYVRLHEVRAHLSHLPKDEVDRTLQQMAREKRIHLAPNDYQSTLTPEQRAGAVEFGGRANHLIMVEDPLDVRATPVTYNRRGEPQFTRREGETPEQAATRYRREYAESPAGQREAARAALRPRVEALADRIRRMDNAEDITAAIEAGQLPTEALKLLAEEVDVDPAAVGRVGGRRQRIALLAELLAQEVRKGPGGFR